MIIKSTANDVWDTFKLTSELELKKSFAVNASLPILIAVEITVIKDNHDFDQKYPKNLDM
jgi:hypothetical protein